MHVIILMHINNVQVSANARADTKTALMYCVFVPHATMTHPRTDRIQYILHNSTHTLAHIHGRIISIINFREINNACVFSTVEFDARNTNTSVVRARTSMEPSARGWVENVATGVKRVIIRTNKAYMCLTNT